MPKILITTSSFNVAASKSLTQLAQVGWEIVTNPHGRRLKEDEVAELLEADVVGMVAGTEPLTRSVLEGANGLKVVSRCGIGLDSVDLEAARDLGIEVLNTPDAPSVAVAELTIGMVLDQLRRISQADHQIRVGQWKPLMGGLLAARTVGVVGYGRIGRRVAKLAQAFGCRVLATDAAVRIDADGVVKPCSLEQLLAEADIVTLHLPAQKGGGHFLDAAKIGMMKDGAVLVNTARGGLIDEVALAEAIRDGRLAGAALDTFEREPYVGSLIELPQVVLTAHMGSYANEARSIMETEAADNLYRALAVRGLGTGGAG